MSRHFKEKESQTTRKCSTSLTKIAVTTLAGSRDTLGVGKMGLCAASSPVNWFSFSEGNFTEFIRHKKYTASLPSRSTLGNLF